MAEQLEIIKVGDPILKQVAEPITVFTDELNEYIESMFITMKATNGVGLAAPQVGRSQRFFICQIPGYTPRYAFVNPMIVFTSIEMTTAEEGCLSIPSQFGNVERYKYIRVQGINPVTRSPFRIRAEGLLARVIQHEIDHLDGVLFTERMKPGEELKRDGIAL